MFVQSKYFFVEMLKRKEKIMESKQELIVSMILRGMLGSPHIIDAFREIDRKYLKFADDFENRFVTQGYEEDRTIVQTLDLGWELLNILPKEELKRIKEEHIAKYYGKSKTNQD